MRQPKMSDLKYDPKGTAKLRKAFAQTDKVKITINFDSDVLNEVKKISKKTGTPYQTLLNKMIRDSLAKKKHEEDRLDRLEAAIEKINKKLAA